MKKVLSVYTHSMTTIYLSLSAQVAISAFFMKSPLPDFETTKEVALVLKLNKNEFRAPSSVKGKGVVL